MLYRILLSPESEGAGAGPGDELVTISRAELEELRRPSPATAGPEPEGREIDPLGDRERRLAEREEVFRSALRDRELAVALADRPLVPGAAAQLVKLWRDEFDVYEEDGRFQVAARDGRGVGQAVAEWLASPEYAHFCPPRTRGGTAVPGPGVGRPGSGGGEPSPRTLGEMLLRRWQESASRPDPSSGPVGLRRGARFARGH